MVIDTRVDFFNEKWNFLINEIGKSTTLFRNKRRALFIKDFYFMRVKANSKADYDCIECYNARRIPADDDEAKKDAMIKGRRFYITKSDLLNCYLLKWDRKEDIDELQKGYFMYKELVKHYEQNGFISSKDEYYDARQKMRSMMRERNRILNEQTAIKILLLHLQLKNREGL